MSVFRRLGSCRIPFLHLPEARVQDSQLLKWSAWSASQPSVTIYAQPLGARLPPNLGLGPDRQPYIAVDQPCRRRSRSFSDVRALDFALRATAGQQPYHFRFDVQILGVVATSLRPVQVLIGMAQTLFVQLAVWKVVLAFSGPQRPTASCLIYKERDRSYRKSVLLFV